MYVRAWFLCISNAINKDIDVVAESFVHQIGVYRNGVHIQYIQIDEADPRPS